MTLRDKIKAELQKVYGDFEVGLETTYRNKIVYEILVNDYEKKTEWVTFNQVLIELKKNLELKLKFKELLYRITDEEDPQNACISVLKNIYPKSEELDRLYLKIKSFK